MPYIRHRYDGRAWLPAHKYGLLMAKGTDYIATWFYKENADEASYYPQMGGGSARYVHLIYMQILVPFFTTFRRYNPRAGLLFFSNPDEGALPGYLVDTLRRNEVEHVTVPYTCRPPKGWYKAWMNQYYLYDILRAMEKRMQPCDTLLVCDADCLCRKPLDQLFDSVRRDGSALYDCHYPDDFVVNGTTRKQMEEVYKGCFGEEKHFSYYGGEFIALRGDAVARINRVFPVPAKYNFALPEGGARLHEEAHFLSVLAARLDLCNDTANKYVKRMYTSSVYNNVEAGDEQLAVWHVLSEKKTGLYRLYRLIRRNQGMGDEAAFWKKAGEWCGIPHTSLKKRVLDVVYRQIVKRGWNK